MITRAAPPLASTAVPEHELVERAREYVEPLYVGSSGASGGPLLDHVLAAVQTLSDLRLDPGAIAAALLYPAYARSPDAAAVIRERFGAAVADLAEGVVRMGQIGALSARGKSGSKQQGTQLESLRKMLLAMVQDVRVVLIGLADHLQTLRESVRVRDPGLQRATAELTRDIFAPLANRLGVWHLKWELEDLAFRLLEADTYKTVARLLDEKRLDRERYIAGVVAVLQEELARAGIHAEVSGRPKHLYSIYKKMQRKGVGFEALHDVRAVRVLVGDVKDCYAVLGTVHNLWSPIPKEFDDYIAKPKSNDYRSLHTAVIGPEGKAVEVQIRTFEMHQHSEFGVAAHWRYKEGGARHDRTYDEKIAWLRQILEWKEDVSDTSELAEQFKTQLFADSVYVLTPQGRVVDLPKGATPIDFAYHVHTDLGHRCRGAKVDGAIVPLNTPLHNGQQVEIMPAKQGGPSRDWLNPALGFIKSHAGRSKVRQWFNRQNLEADVAQGRAILEKELQRHGMTALNLDKLATEMGYARLNDLLSEIGRGDIGPKQLQEALKPAPVEEPQDIVQPIARKSRAGSQSSVLVVGMDKLLTLPAKCCKPAPPDRIVGFVTRGRGVSVHRASCTNVKRLDPQRCVTAEWGDSTGATFPAEISVEAIDRTGLLRDISEVLTRERVNVTATSTQTTAHVAYMRFTLEIENVEQLQRVLAFVRDVRGVMSAGRR